jgi:hypothetical protein
VRPRPSSWSSSLEGSRACLGALSLLFLLLQAGCAGLWGFDDLTLASEAGAPDGSMPGRDSGPGVDGGGDDGSMGQDDGGPSEGGTTCPTDSLNCGGCGVACDTNHSFDAKCVAVDGGGFTCQYGPCPAGLADCDQSGANIDGCETSLTSTSSCGACGNACDTAQSRSAACVIGSGGMPTCQYAGCAPGFEDCNGTPPDLDGCETSTATPMDCGGCGIVCDATKSQGASCLDGKTCQYTGCNTGYADCNATAPDTDGCETMVTSSTCMLCGGTCDVMNSNGETCVNGTCNYATCKTGFANCNTTPPDINGCETSITTTSNCGACGVACDLDLKTSAGAACSGVGSGANCTYTGCASGYVDCDKTAHDTNGCESSLSSTASCGGCGNACNTKTGAAKCNGTTCSYTCNQGSTDCNAATAPDTDGCECATPGCCSGGKCQTIHANGVGEKFYDCNAAGTHTAAQATEACEAAAGSGHCTGSSKCCALSALGLCLAGATAQSECGIVAGACYCWQYAGNYPGTVQSESPSACTASCGASGDTAWN